MDADLDALAALLGLTWRTPPYPTNATTPGSALHIVVHDPAPNHDGYRMPSYVSAHVHYNSLDSQGHADPENGITWPSTPFATVPAVWEERSMDRLRKPNEITLFEFKLRVLNNTRWSVVRSCVQSRGHPTGW